MSALLHHSDTSFHLISFIVDSYFFVFFHAYCNGQCQIFLFSLDRCLQQVRDAFDPLNTHKSSNLQSSNVIDLAKTIQNLAETIRFRLLPPGPVFNSNPFNVDRRVWTDNLTKGESSAQEVMFSHIGYKIYNFTGFVSS